MKAVIFERFGDPTEVLRVREIPKSEPGLGEVRVRMIASPINPSDLLVVRGTYGRLPELPATPGFEGVGVVEAAGPGLLGRLRVGKRVAVLNGKGGNWREYVIVSARQVVPIPSAVSDDQAAVFFVNPASALIMTRYLLGIQPGEWLAQSAAGSALGQMVIRLGRHFGFHTINLVRRREQRESLLKMGADAVICTDDEPIEKHVKSLTQGKGVAHALDAVGGATGSALISSLASGGRLIVYGTLSGDPITIDPRALMVSRVRVEGFWLSQWMRDQRVWNLLSLFRQLGKLMSAGIVTSPIAATYSMEQIQEAVQQADRAGKNGKVLLRIGNP